MDSLSSVTTSIKAQVWQFAGLECVNKMSQSAQQWTSQQIEASVSMLNV